jgi:hypothetical protein
MLEIGMKVLSNRAIADPYEYVGSGLAIKRTRCHSRESGNPNALHGRPFSLKRQTVGKPAVSLGAA